MPNIKVQPSGNVYEYEVGNTLLEVHSRIVSQKKVYS